MRNVRYHMLTALLLVLAQTCAGKDDETLKPPTARGVVIDDAPAFVHVVDVRPSPLAAWAPFKSLEIRLDPVKVRRRDEEAADAQLKVVLEHVTRLRPQPHALVIAGTIGRAESRKALVESMADVLPPVHHVLVFTGDERLSILSGCLFEHYFGPVRYSFEAGTLRCTVQDKPPTDAKTLTFSGQSVSGSVRGRPFRTRTPNIHTGDFPGTFRVFWPDLTCRTITPADEPVFRWIYPTVGETIPSGRLRLLASAYDANDVRRTPTRPQECWRLATLAGKPGAKLLEETDVSQLTFTGVCRRSLVKPGPFLDAGLHVCQVAGLKGLGVPLHTVSFEVLDDIPPLSNLGTSWSGPGANDFHSGVAPVTLVPPLRLAGWARTDGPPLLVLDKKMLLDGTDIAGTFRWAETKRRLIGMPTKPFDPTGPRPVMNSEYICWLAETGELTWLPVEGALKPAEANKLVGSVRLLLAPLVNGERLAPALLDNIALVVGPNREAVAVNLKTAAVLWRRTIDEFCLTPVATEEGFILGNVCLSIRTGRDAWKSKGPRFVRSQVTLTDKRVLVTGLIDEGKPGRMTQVVACIQVHTGKELWRRRLCEVNAHQDVRTPGAVVADDGVLVGSADGVFYALDIEDGSVRWKYSTGPSLLKLDSRTGDTSARITARAVVSEKVVYFAGYDGVLRALDVRQGKKLFTRQLGMPIVDDPVISGNSLLVPTCDGLLFWFIPTADTR